MVVGYFKLNQLMKQVDYEIYKLRKDWRYIE